MKTSAPGDKAEGNFKNRLVKIVGTILTSTEKNSIITLMEQFNTIYPNFYKKEDIERFHNETIKIIDVKKVGSTKSSEFKTKKNDIRIDTDFILSNQKKFSIGISFKKGTAQTVQSWSSIETWEYIFQVTKTKKHYLKNVLNVLLKLTKIHAENTENLFIGSTIHLSPLDTTYEEKYKKNKDTTKKLKKIIQESQKREETDNTEYFQNFIETIEEEKELQYQLNKYMNKILEKNELLFHTILFGDPNEQCLLYYAEKKNEIKNFHRISDLFNDLGNELFICGTKSHRYSVLKKLKNRINVSERYVYPCSTSSNNSNQYLVVWNNDIEKKDYIIRNNHDLLEHAEPRKPFLTYSQFKKKYHDSPKYLNFTNLQKFFKNKFNIQFRNIAKPSKDHIDLDKEFYDIIKNDYFSIKQKIDHIIISFSMKYYDILRTILSEEDYNKCVEQIDEFFYRYVVSNITPTESNLVTVVKFLRRILQMKYEKELGEENTRVGRTLKPIKRKKDDMDEISQIFEPVYKKKYVL